MPEQTLNVTVQAAQCHRTEASEMNEHLGQRAGAPGGTQQAITFGQPNSRKECGPELPNHPADPRLSGL
jgi:hypothetical protein